MIYELLYIIPSRFSETEVDGIIKETQALLEKSEAKVEKTTSLGKVKLAYPIKKERYGTYILSYFTVDNQNLDKLNKDLELFDSVLRHVIVKRPEGIPTFSFDMVAYQEPITPEGKKVFAKSAKKEAKKAPQREKLSQEELDKKLDSILDGEDDELTNV